MSDKLESLKMLNGSGQAEVAIMELTRQKGFMEQYGVKAELHPVKDGRQGVDALLAKEGDICLRLGIGPALAAIDKGEPIRLLAGANLLAVHAIFTSHDEVVTVADLEGRRVGIGSLGALAHQLITARMMLAGADPSKVNWVPIGNTSMVFKEICSREVDAGLGEVDVIHQQEQFGVRVLPDGKLWEELPNFVNQGSFATLETIETRREILVAALAASATLYRHLVGPESEQTYIKARTAAYPDGDMEEIHSQWRFYQSHKPHAVNLLLNPDNVRFVQEVNVRMGLQDKVHPFEAVADMSLAEEALDMVGRV